MDTGDAKFRGFRTRANPLSKRDLKLPQGMLERFSQVLWKSAWKSIFRQGQLLDFKKDVTCLLKLCANEAERSRTAMSQRQNPGITKSFFLLDSLTPGSFPWSLRVRTPVKRHIDV
jgi:hypothetical protein